MPPEFPAVPNPVPEVDDTVNDLAPHAVEQAADLPPDAPFVPTTKAGRHVPTGARLALLLGSLTGLAPLTIDMYLPALPTLATEFGVTDAAVQLTLTGTLIGLAAGQIVLGPLSDSMGRRKPLLGGIALHFVASLLCALAPGIAMLGVLRLVQGFGAAAATVVAMAIVRDLLTGRPAAVLLSRLVLVIGAAPVLAPTIGSAVLGLTSWRGLFVVLAVAAAILFICAWFFLPETLPVERRRKGGLRPALRSYRELLRDRVVVGLVLVGGLTLAGVFAFVAGASFVFQDQFGFGALGFGLLFGLGALGLIAGSQLNPWLLHRAYPQQLLTAALICGTISGAALLTTAITGFGGVPGLVVPLWFVLFSAGLAFPHGPAIALTRHGENAGAVAALLGATQFGVAAIAAPMVGVLGSDATAMGAVVLTGMSLALVVLLVVVRPRQLTRADAAA